MKPLLRAFFRIPGLLFAAWYGLKRMVLGEDKAFLALTERLAGFKGYLGIYLRAAVYHHVLARSSEEVQVGHGTVFSKREAVLEEHVYVGRYCSLGWVHLERDVMLADFVAIPSGGATHRLTADVPPRLMENRYTPVRVGRGTWVGTHAVILADIGRSCVIGAGAVVTRAIPDYSVAVGVPAKVVGRVEGAPGGGLDTLPGLPEGRGASAEALAARTPNGGGP
jgi:acetyltransferase-like isoleucine patch superfamily enzyme